MEINEASLRGLTETQIPSFNMASLKYRETATADVSRMRPVTWRNLF